MTKTKTRSARKPRLLITSRDLEILDSMVGSAPKSAAAKLLEDELGRAVVVNESLNDKSFCRVGSWVRYQDRLSGQTREVQLVLPADSDIDKRCVSVLSLVGAALLGLSVGAEFEWTDDKGRPHGLKVLDVVDGHDVG